MTKHKTSVSEFDLYVGKRLRTLRQGHGESQQVLGDQCDLTFQQIQKYEKGANHLSLSRAYEIAKIYKVHVSYFTEGYEEALITGEYGNTLPLSNRASMQAAKLYNALPTPRLQKAILDVMNVLAVDKPKT